MKRLLQLVAVFFQVVLMAQVICAATYVNSQSGNWSTDSSWTPSGAKPSAGGAYDTTIIFSPSAQDDSYNNLAGSFVLNQLALTANQNVILNQSGDSSLLFTNNGTILPGITNSGSATLTIATPIVMATNTIFSNGGSINVNSSISESAVSKLIKNGSGTLTLSTANTYSGGTEINGGAILLSHNSALGSGTVTISPGTVLGASPNHITVAGGVKYILNGDFNTFNSAKNIDFGPGAVTINTPLSLGVNNSVSFGGTISGPGGLNALDIVGVGYNGIGYGLTFSGPITLRTNQTVSGRGENLAGSIGDDGKGYGLNVAAGITLSAANTYSGDTTITSGGLSVNHNLALQNSAFVTGTVTPGFSVNTPTLGGLKGSASITLPSNITALTLNPLAGRTHSFSGVLAGGASGMTLTKTGAGTQMLSGDCTYSGATTVNAGTLLINASVGSSVAVATNASFGGTGTIGGNVTLAAGASAVFTPGSPMTITGSLILNNNAVRVILPQGLSVGTYRLVNFNALGSSGAFFVTPAIDSGSAFGFPSISMGEGKADLVISALATVITIR